MDPLPGMAVVEGADLTTLLREADRLLAQPAISMLNMT